MMVQHLVQSPCMGVGLCLGQGSMLCHRVDVIVVRELSEGQEFIPIVLSFVHEQLDILFQLLVQVFGLTIRLWVVSGGW
jgi:hypothetical protein